MFSSSSHAELLALLRAIVEAKFHKDPGDLDVPGSAVLAQVALRVRDAVIAFEVQREGATWVLPQLVLRLAVKYAKAAPIRL